MSVKTKTATKPSIPAAIRSTAPSDDDLLNDFGGGTAPAPKTKKTAVRTELKLSSDGEEILRKFIPAKRLAESFNSHFENLRSLLRIESWKSFLSSYWSAKSQPGNPAIVSKVDGKPDMSTMLIVSAKFKVQAENAGEAESLLVQLGLDSVKAKSLVAEELDFSPIIGLRNFNELLKGHKDGKNWIDATDEEKNVARKIMTVLRAELTPEELALARTTIGSTKVKEGFLARVCQYCNTEEQLAAVFQVIQPQQSFKGAEFGINDAEDVRRERLLDFANDVLGTVITEEEDDE